VKPTEVFKELEEIGKRPKRTLLAVGVVTIALGVAYLGFGFLQAYVAETAKSLAGSNPEPRDTGYGVNGKVLQGEHDDGTSVDINARAEQDFSEMRRGYCSQAHNSKPGPDDPEGPEFQVLKCNFATLEDCRQASDGSTACLPNPGRFWCLNSSRPSCFLSAADCRTAARSFERAFESARRKGNSKMPKEVRCDAIHDSSVASH
jgi:hypothetical protein